MITIYVRPGRRGKLDRAHCEIGNECFVATSSNGSVAALCRVLVAAGIEDQPWEMVNLTAPDRWAVRGDSIRKQATVTYSEADGTIQRRPWKAWDSRDGSAPMSVDP